MGVLPFKRLVYTVFIVSATINLANGASHSGLVTQYYSEHTLAEENVCHPLGKKGEIKLENRKNAAIIVKPGPGWNNFGIKKRSCLFVVKARKGDHLMAVVQSMSLRGNESQCFDYVTFKRKDKLATQKICGQVHSKQVSYRSQQENPNWDMEVYAKNGERHAEFDLEGEIETNIVFGNLPSDLSSEEAYQDVHISIVFTPYKDCGKIKSDRSEYQETNSNICVWKGFYCDGFYNCHRAICNDEENCPPIAIVSDGTGTKVTIGAVTTIVLCLIIFVMSLWICRRHKRLCWSSDCAGPNQHDNRYAHTERIAENLSANPNSSVAVAPMLEVAVLPAVADKDLPPSYDSLFPEQSNPSTT